jgi:hypothetical protein
MKKLFFFYLMIILFGNIRANNSNISVTPAPVGEWRFDDQNNLGAATIGNPLVPYGDKISAVSGPTETDGAVRVGVGSYYILTHGIAPNNGSFVNTYTFVFDFKVSQLGRWYSFFQTNPANQNDNDAELFINFNGNIGVSATGYTGQTINENTWNRMAVVVNNELEYSIYINGIKWLTGNVQQTDGRFSLESKVLLFADNDGEDNEIDIARVLLYNKALTEEDIKSLGGYEQPARVPRLFASKPYIQNVTPTSATIMWESDFSKPGTVNYGTTSALNKTVTTTVTPSGACTYIHKATLASLKENTTYHFQAITNDSTAEKQTLKTATTDFNTSFKVGIWGDSHHINPFSVMASYLVNNLNVDFCVTSGDVSNSGGNDSVDLRRIFINNVLDIVGSKVPFYESFGNHDVDGGNLIRHYVEQPTEYNSDASKVSGSYAYFYGNSVFITIDWSRYATDLAPDGWLETFLKSPVSKQARFRFIFIHCPPFMERWQGAEQSYVKTRIPLICKEYGVTAVFSGHMHGYERGVLDGVQYITQGGASYLDVNESVGPTIYPHIIVGTNKPNNPANFNNGLMNHLLTLEITPNTATIKLHYFDASGNYLGVIESVVMNPINPGSTNTSSPGETGFSIFPNPTKGNIKINAPENFNVSVFNLQGNKVFSMCNVSPDSDINLSHLRQGLNFVRLEAGKKTFTEAIFLQ